jgi:hypothetical protein
MVRRISVVLLALAWGSCSEPTLTEMLIVVDSDLRVSDELARVTFRVLGPRGNQQAAVTDFAAGDPRPAVLSLVHRGGPLGPLTISVTGDRGAAETVRQRVARVSFIEGRSVMLRMDLLRSCGGLRCGEEETCADGGCRAIDIDPSELVDWNGFAPPLDGSVSRMDGGTDGGTDAGMDARVECTAGACDDGIDCTTDSCVDGLCSFVPDHGACAEDSIDCTSARCSVTMGCVQAPDDAMCDDGVDCTADTCDPASGCAFAPDDTLCSDGVDCTTQRCEATSGCMAPVPDDTRCDDGIECTGDRCDPALGCASSTSHALCPEGELCDTSFARACVAAPTFADVYAVLEAECTPCHFRGTNSSGDLDMSTPALAHANLVGVTATCGAGVNTRVVPRDARTSLLWRKLTGVDLCGGRMPRERTMLPSTQITLIEQWINGGAAN